MKCAKCGQFITPAGYEWCNCTHPQGGSCACGPAVQHPCHTPEPAPPTLDEALRAYGLAMTAEVQAKACLERAQRARDDANDAYDRAFAEWEAAVGIAGKAQKGVQEAAAHAIDLGVVSDAENLEARR